MQENVRGIRVVKSFNREDYEISKFKSIPERIYHYFYKGEKLIAFNSPIMQFFMYACMILISWIGAKAIVASGNNTALGMTTGDLTAFLSYATQILTSLMMLSMVFVMITMSLAQLISSVFTIVAVLICMLYTSIWLTIVALLVMLLILQIVKGIAGKVGTFFMLQQKTLADINGYVEEMVNGQKVIKGGKSTLLKLIMRFWDKDSGRILLSGTDVTDINTKSLRENESYCTQETHLFHDTIGNNIRIANLSATDEEIIAAAKKASIHDFIAALPHGYDTRVGELGDTLSGGEKQRISLARAFLSDAPLMLLDEPTSNLDSINEGIILKALDDAKDRTIVLVSHRKSTLGICDSLHQMENGHKNNENLIGE